MRLIKLKATFLDLALLLVFLSPVSILAQQKESSHLVKAKVLAGAGKFDEAISELNLEIAANPNEAEAYYWRGVCWGNEFDLDQHGDLSIADSEKAVELDRKEVYVGQLTVAYFNKAGGYYNRGDYAQAVTYYSKAVDLRPEFAEAYRYRAMAYLGQKDYAKTWDDVHKLESLGFKAYPDFIAELKKASGRNH